MDSKQKRTYSRRTKSETLAVLQRLGGNFHRAAQETGISVRTIRRWASDAERHDEMQTPQPVIQVDQNLPISQQLEQIARLMIRAMPERLSDANLQELARSLAIVVQTMQQTTTEKVEEKEPGEVYERVSGILDRYRAARRAAGLSEPADDR